MLQIGRAIRIIREAKGFRQNQVAKAARISTGFLSLLESGARDPSLRVLRSVAVALDVPVEALLILGQPVDTKLELTDLKAKEFTDCIRRMSELEERLRTHRSDGSRDASSGPKAG